MDEHRDTDEYSQRKQAGEEPGDILAEEARLTERGLLYPLNMMHTLYYESSGDTPDALRGFMAEPEVVVHPQRKTKVQLYEQYN